VARTLAELPIGAAARARHLARAGMPRKPQDLLQHTLIGYGLDDRDDTIGRGFAVLGLALPHQAFALRIGDHVARGPRLAAGAGIGWVAPYNTPHRPGAQRLLPMLKMLQIPPLSCWLAVHGEIRGNKAVRRVHDFLADAIARELARTG
jgi:DNA-binding transcriptional LysR family regulator